MTSERAARIERIVTALLLPAALALLCALIARGNVSQILSSPETLLAEYALFLPALLALHDRARAAAQEQIAKLEK